MIESIESYFIENLKLFIPPMFLPFKYMVKVVYLACVFVVTILHFTQL